MTDTSIKFQGAKYTGTYQPAAMIAKAIRSDVTTAVRDGDLPAEIEGRKITYRVTCHNSAGGRSIDVNIDGCPDSWALREREPGEYGYHFGGMTQTDEARALVEKVEALRQAYNQDRSDVMTDYFHVNYYGSTDLWGERTQAFWAKERARKARKS